MATSAKASLVNTFFLLFFFSRSYDPRAKGYILKSDFISSLYRQLGLNSHSGVDIPSLADSLSTGKWVPYPKFLAMFEGEQPDLPAGSGAGDDQDDPMASLEPEKLKVYIMMNIVACTNVTSKAKILRGVFKVNFTTSKT